MPAIAVRTLAHPRGWILIPVTVCGIWHGHFMLNTFTPISSVSASTATMLEALQCFTPQASHGHLLRTLTIGGVPLPELPVRISRAATLLDVEGMLGLDFLRQFTAIRFDVPAGTLTLDLP